MKNKIIFFDIDGTLYDQQKKIPETTVEAIRELKNRGIYVAIATGRAPFMFEELRNQLGIDSYVSFNGQYVVFEGKLVYANPLNRHQLNNMYHRAFAQNIPMVFMNESEMRSTVEQHDYIHEAMKSLKLPYPEKDSNFYQHSIIYQALLFYTETQDKDDFPVNDYFKLIRWHEVACDVLPYGTSKATGIARLLEVAGFKKQDSIAFGDGLNDIEMIKEVGIGVAMGNAVPELIHVADYVTDSVDNGGVLKGLQYLKLL